jgi:hypothetical protein
VACNDEATMKAMTMCSIFAGGIAIGGIVLAGPKVGSDATVTAYDYAGKRVLAVVACDRGALGPEYPSCIAETKRQVRHRVCQPGVGKVLGGRTYFRYRMGVLETLIADTVGVCGG